MNYSMHREGLEEMRLTRYEKYNYGMKNTKHFDSVLLEKNSEAFIFREWKCYFSGGMVSLFKILRIVFLRRLALLYIRPCACWIAFWPRR